MIRSHQSTRHRYEKVYWGVVIVAGVGYRRGVCVVQAAVAAPGHSAHVWIAGRLFFFSETTHDAGGLSPLGCESSAGCYVARLMPALRARSGSTESSLY